MPGLGEWDTAGSPTPPPVPEPGSVPERGAAEVATSVAGLDVEDVAGGLVSSAVQALIAAEVKEVAGPIVATAVAEIFTPERTAALQEAVAAAARQALEASAAEPDLGSEEDPPAELYYGSVDEFVREMIVPVFSRKVGERASRHWSARWWESTEVVIRLEALWRSWEHLRLDPATGMSVWLRDHLDHHLAVLMAQDGPFESATDSAKPGEPLPYEPPPPGLFTDVRRKPTAPPPGRPRGASRKSERVRRAGASHTLSAWRLASLCLGQPVD